MKQSGIKWLAVLVGLAACVAMGAGSISSVSSYSAPNLVSEINTSLGQADTRLDTLEAGTVSGQSSITLSNANNAGSATISMQSDKGDDAGDKFAIVAQDGGTLAIQSDLSVKGTLATKASLSSAGALTVTALSTGTGEASVDSKYAVVGGDATTGLMVQKANRTAGTNATETITFATVFGAAPTVVCTYTEDPGDVRPIFVTSVTASNFVANITADKNYGYIAVGTRP